MVQLIEQKKRQKILIGALIIVIILTIFFWYLNYQKEPSYEEFGPTQGGATLISDFEQRFKEIKLDLSILDDPLFKSLKSHGALPVAAGETGRGNPFVSY